MEACKCGFIIVDKQTPVPLREVNTEVSIKGFIAHVQSKLEYQNEETTPIETEFVFPLDNKTAVYKLEAELNGRHIVAECQDKAQAKETYSDAISSGHSAMLMSEDDDAGDIFHLRLGNLDANSKAVLTFAYVVELDVELDGVVRFTLPTVLCPRYTPEVPEKEKKETDETPPSVMTSPNVITNYNSGQFKMTFSATVSGPYKIEKITSPNNDISSDIGQDKMGANISLQESFKYDHDLTFDLQYGDFMKPEIVLEKGLLEKEGFLKNDVLMLNFLPEWPENMTETRCEFVFVIDRSGSMTGHRIEKAKEALLLMLKSLPSDSMFNVISFGTNYTSLFKKSEQYNKGTLDKALKLQKEIGADMGGTEIYKPLEEVYKSKPSEGYQRQIFLLTDGSVSNTQSVITLIQKNASSTRVFTFGIGNGCSTELIRQGAKVSKGLATFVKDTERLQSKVMSVMKKSTAPAVSNFSLTWKLPNNVSATLVPKEVPCVFKGGKLILYAIIQGDTKEYFQSSLNFSASMGEKDAKYTLNFDLTKVSTVEETGPLHRMAAKAQLEEMETRDDYEMKPLMVAVSTATNVVCRHTAFVGVDRDTNAIVGQQPVYDDEDEDEACYYLAAPLMSYSLCSSELSSTNTERHNRSYDEMKPLMVAVSTATNAVCRHTAFVLGDRGINERVRHQADYGYKAEDCYSSACQDMSYSLCASDIKKKSYGFAGFKFSMPKIFSRSKKKSSAKSSSHSMPSSEYPDTCGVFSHSSAPMDNELETSRDCFEANSRSIGGLKKSKEKKVDRMMDLISKQTFEGYWDLDDSLADILGKTMKELEGKCPIKDTKVWATVLALAYLEKMHSKRKSEWEMIEQKANLWIFAQNLQGKTEKDLMAEARLVL